MTSHLLDKRSPLERAIAELRIFSMGRTIRVRSGLSLVLGDALRRRGFSIEVEYGPLGTVHAAQFEMESGMFIGAADPAYDGTAAVVMPSAVSRRPPR